MKRVQSKSAFTLVEIMIVVAIIGLLASIGIPNMLKAGRRARSTKFAKEIKNAGHAFVQYSFDNGQYPADRNPSQMPTGMDSYLNEFPWAEDTPIGGQWDWDYGQFGVSAGVSVYSPSWSSAQMQEIDAMIDDGNLSTGEFRQRSGGYIYVLEN